MKTHQVNKKQVQNNQNDINGKFNGTCVNNTYSQKMEKQNLKGGVTTVIQHYSGSRKQYQNYKK